MGQVIGITGGIASGKSKVCHYLAELCQLPVINLDELCRQLLQPGAPGWLAIEELTGEKFLSAEPGREIDRQAFRNALFADSRFRRQVDGLLHPLARAEMTARIERINGMVLVEIPLLFEAGWQDDVETIIVVYADRAVQVQRVIDRDHVSEEQAEQAVIAQMSPVKKVEQADYVIDNSLSWQHSCLQLQKLSDCLGCR
jgi:dephospho-CoA kinase